MTTSGSGSPSARRPQIDLDCREAKPPAVAAFPCQECGACCAHSDSWPRFSLESDAELARIPERLVAADLSGMRCEGNRCMALIGEIATWTTCTIYAVRPQVCRECVAGDDACTMARERVGLPRVPLAE